MRNILSLILFLTVIVPFQADGDEIIKKDETLTLRQCIDIAMKLHPNIIAAKNSIAASESRVGQAEANYFPQIGASSGYSRISPVSSLTSNSSSTSDQAYDQYTSSVTLSQTLFDFGKTPTQVRIQNLNLNSSRADFRNSLEQITFNVKQAYYGVLQAKRSRDVAAETVTQFQQHLEQAKGFYEVGLKPKFDVTKAEVDLSNSKLNLIKAENALKIAKVVLNNTVGLTDAPEYKIEDNLVYEKQTITLENALALAFKNRPDLHSLQLKTKASEESIELAKKGYFPVLTGSAAYNWAAQKFPLEHGWNAGVTITLPIFSGYLTKHQVEESRANLNIAKANEDVLRQQIIFDLQQAYLKLREAEERIPTAELAVTQATENLDIANGRYEAGVGNPIEVTDAQISYINAKTSYIQALYDYKVAQASLDKAMGVK
ncbi:MAG: TolC family protein [Thermodesulfovibrio sp.]|nr:TolC family protein [Thermodesulfovibrio sp.]